MHITRIEVRHWRRHNQLLIDGLSDRINLISGQNEAGKTTIAEALRYALFEPCKPNYDARKAIQQRLASEAPEVEVDLLVAEQQWRIEKRFLKRQMTKLTDPNGRIVEGDDAEQKIQELLGINIPNAGRVSKDVDIRHLGLWPILWLRQGELSGLDGAVTDGVRSKLSELVAHEVGAVSAGPLGSRALDLVQREHDLFWTSSALKPTGEYAKAMKDYEAALSGRDQARNQLQIFEVTVRDLQELTDRLGTLGPRQRAAEEQADVMRVRARQATQRLRELEQHRGQLEGFRRESVEVTKLQTQRKQLEANLVSCQANYAKFSAQESGLEAERQRLEQTKFRLDSVANTTQQGAKDAHERAEQAREIAERESLSLRIAERTTQLQRIEDLVQAHRQAIAVVESIPEISSRTLKDLQGKAAAYRDACLQRDAASTAIVFQSELSLYDSREVFCQSEVCDCI